MAEILVAEETQRIIVTSQQRIIVDSDNNIDVTDQTTSVKIIPAGPQGPPGVKGDKGEDGLDSGAVVEAMMIAHVNSPTPHPAYDDIPDLKTHLENGLF